MRPKSVEWHVAVGRTLKEVQHLLLNLTTDTANVYGKTSTTARKAGKAADAVSGLRHMLDEEFFREHPGKFDSHVYYGG